MFDEVTGPICDKQIAEKGEDVPHPQFPLMRDCSLCEGNGFAEFHEDYCYLKKMEPPRTFILKIDDDEQVRLVCCPNCICWKCGLQNAYCGSCGCLNVKFVNKEDEDSD